MIFLGLAVHFLRSLSMMAVNSLYIRPPSEYKLFHVLDASKLRSTLTVRDLDNLLKRLLDALGKTVFSETAGGDSCIISLSAMKAKVASEEEAGALVEILPVSV